MYAASHWLKPSIKTEEGKQLQDKLYASQIYSHESSVRSG